MFIVYVYKLFQHFWVFSETAITILIKIGQLELLEQSLQLVTASIISLQTVELRPASKQINMLT